MCMVIFHSTFSPSSNSKDLLLHEPDHPLAGKGLPALFCGWGSPRSLLSLQISATPLTNCFAAMTRPLYEPSPRWGHFSAPINGQLYMWGGHAANFSSNKAEFASTVNIFDPYLETWNKTFPKGSPPPGLYFGACASSGDSLFTYGGSNGVHCGSFHQLNTSTQTWTELESDGPMSKYGSRMIAHGHDLVLFGGYAFPSGSTLQLNSSFVRNYNFSDGRGWTNELHLYSTKESKMFNIKGIYSGMELLSLSSLVVAGL